MSEHGGENGRVLRCDHCGRAVVVKGVREPVYTHQHGTVFCMVSMATVDGRGTPEVPDIDGSDG